MAKAPKTTKRKTTRERSVDDETGLLSTLEEDSVYRRITKKLDGMMRMFDPNEKVEALQTLHASRGIRTLSVQKILSNQVTQMVTADLENTAYRSRTVEIKMQCVRNSYQFTEALGTLKKYILAEYDKTIRQEVGNTAADRNNYVDTLFRAYNQYSNELDMLFDLCDVVLADYDSAGYALMRIQKTLEAVARDRG